MEMSLIVRCLTPTTEATDLQSCSLGVPVIKSLSAGVTSYVLLSLDHKDIICHVEVSESSCSEVIEYFSTVYRPKPDTDSKLLHGQDTCSLKLLKTRQASHLEVHFVVLDIKNLKQFKQDVRNNPDRLEEMAKNLLFKFCVSSGFVVSLEYSYLSRLYGISHVLINSCVNDDSSCDACIVNNKTSINVTDVQSFEKFVSKQNTTLPLIGGQDSLCEELINLVKISFDFKNYLNGQTLQPPKGVLLRGPPGTGKTSLVKHVAVKANAHLVVINGPEIFGSRPGEMEENLKEIFEKALLYSEEGPCILFIDEIDTLCPRRNSDDDMQGKRATTQILQFMDRIRYGNSLVIIGATNRPSDLDPGIRRPGRLDKEVMMNVPTRQQRVDILTQHISKLPISDDLDTEKLADITNGFVGADLASLCHEAAYLAMEDSRKMSENDPSFEDSGFVWPVSMCHFLNAAKGIVPSLLKGAEGLLDVSPVHWDSIGGLEVTKLQIRQVIEWPVKHPEAFQRMGLPCPRGVLLHGPPGCCKTTLVRAAATASNANFLSLSGAQLYSPYVGDSEKMVSEVFQRARAGAPSIVFLDEIESIIGKRSDSSSARSVQERVLSTLLNEMDGIGVRLDEKIEADSHLKTKMLEGQINGKEQNIKTEKVDTRNVLVVAATNRPDLLDEALMRPGRIDRILYVPPPDREARLQILKIYTQKMPTEGVSVETLASVTKHYTGADLENLCKEAGLNALTEDISAPVVMMPHFTTALSKVKPSLTAEMIQKSEKMASKWNSFLK